MLPIQRKIVVSGAYFCSWTGIVLIVPPVTLICAHCIPVLAVQAEKSFPVRQTLCVTQRDSAAPTLRYCTFCMMRSSTGSNRFVVPGWGIYSGFIGSE